MPKPSTPPEELRPESAGIGITESPLWWMWWATDYIKHGGKETTDKHHREFPNLASWGTEEGSTVATRGIYFEDNQKHFKPAYDLPQNKDWYSIEQGWKHYDSRDYLAGMYIWTGFDYRGEPTPYQWPSTGSYFGMLDQCGFYKDDAWYLKSLVGGANPFCIFYRIGTGKEKKTNPSMFGRTAIAMSLNFF